MNLTNKQVLQPNSGGWQYLRLDGIQCRRNEVNKICEGINIKTGSWVPITDKSFIARVMHSGSLLRSHSEDKIGSGEIGNGVRFYR